MCKRARLCVAVAMVAMMASLSWATLVPIDSAVAGDPNVRPYILKSVTVGGVEMPMSRLMTGTTSWIQDPNTKIADPNMDDFDINTMIRWSGRTGNFEIIFPVPWTNTNGDANDFIFFEVGGDSDKPVLAAIFPDGTLGKTLTVLPGVNLLPNWKQTQYIRNAADAKDGVGTDKQPIAGIAFAITDLFDVNGLALTNNAVIKGIQIVNRGGSDPAGFFAVAPQIVPLKRLDVNDPNMPGIIGAPPIMATALNWIPTKDLILGVTTANATQQQRADNFDIDSTPGYTGRLNNLVTTMFTVPVSEVFVLEKDGDDDCTVTLLDAAGLATGDPIPFTKSMWMKTKTSEWTIGGVDIKPFKPVYGIQIFSTGVDVISVSAVPVPPLP